VKEWWSKLSPRQRLGGILVAVGIALTVLLAFLGSQTKPPAASTQALIAVFAFLAQVGSAWVFSGDGKVDPTHAQRSVGRLARMAASAAVARRIAEKARDENLPAAAMRIVMGEISVHLSYLEEGYLDAIADWRAFQPEAVENAERELNA
jgi:hypothetical protein